MRCHCDDKDRGHPSVILMIPLTITVEQSIEWPVIPLAKAWFRMPGRSCGVTVMRMLQNAIFKRHTHISVSRILYGKWLLLQWDASFAVIQDPLLKKQLNCRWFESPWRSCGFSLVTMLNTSNLIKSGMIHSKLFHIQWESFDVSFVVSHEKLLKNSRSVFDAMTLMWLHYSDNALYKYSHNINNHLLQMVSSAKGEFGSFLCCLPGHAIEQAVELPVNSDTLTLLQSNIPQPIHSNMQDDLIGQGELWLWYYNDLVYQYWCHLSSAYCCKRSERRGRKNSKLLWS